MRATLILLSALCVAPRLPGGDFGAVRDLAARRAPWLLGHVAFEAMPASGQEEFELRTDHGRIVIRATGPNAAAEGLGWFLKYYCHRSMSHMGDNLSPVGVIPVLEHPVVVQAAVPLRYALNYCTFNYTMSFYSWDDWEHELDWMALSGVNLMLVANGEEAVWRNTLRRLGSTDAEIAAFIPGPAYTAWWLMGNLEGYGGPMTPGMVDRRSALQARILARMRSLGIEPVLPGFYGMVPSSLKARLKAHIVEQGAWGSFRRPDILDPTDPAFARIAAIYYEELARLYGQDVHYFSGDPFHEGGIMAGVDLGRAGVAIQSAMQARFPGSTWVLQGWQENPRKELIASADRTHVLVQELFGEQTHNWETRRGYEGTPFVWCCIDNFGERPGLFGRLQRYADETRRARTGEFGAYMKGVGIMPEGIANNPVAYDFALELAWHGEPVDAARWLGGYVAYRYGTADPDLVAAWGLFLQTVYGEKSGGASEYVLCAKPRSPAGSVTPWGTLEIPYDTSVFSRGVRLFEQAAGRFRGSETYRLDRVALRTQEAANDALGASKQVDAVLASGDRQAFERAAARFIEVGRAANALLATEPTDRLDSYEARALSYGTTPEESKNCLRTALMLVTYWGGDVRGSDVNDYAYKAWGGMMLSYSLKRWEMFFDYRRALLDGKAATKADFDEWERTWVDAECARRTP